MNDGRGTSAVRRRQHERGSLLHELAACGVTVSWLEHIDYRDLGHASLAVLVAGGLLGATGLLLGRRRLLESGTGAVVWTIVTVGANRALLAALEPHTHDSPPVPAFVGAPLLGAALLVVGAFWGAAARRWRPWSGVWLASGVAAAMASGVVAWAHLDRTVVYPESLMPRCMSLTYSTADAMWTGPRWMAVAVAVGVTATLVHAVTPGVPGRAVRFAADGLLALTVLVVVAGLLRVAFHPQPQDYAASLPLVSTARPDRPATYEEMGFTEEDVAFLTRSGRAMPEARRMTILGQVPHDLHLLMSGDGYRRHHVSWVWSDGSHDMTYNGFDRGATLALRHDDVADVWLVTDGNTVLAWLHSSLTEDDYDPEDYDAREVSLRRHYLAWDLIASRIAPPTSWVFAAALGALTALALRATSSKSEEGTRTLMAMRIAVLCAGSTPLLVAAVRGFVFAW